MNKDKIIFKELNRNYGVENYNMWYENFTRESQ